MAADNERNMAHAARLLKSDDEVQTAEGKALVESLASAGDSLAIYAVGTWYLHGANGYARDETKGLEQIKLAADKNIPDAAYDYAFALENGKGVPSNAEEAIAYYLLAAFLGDAGSLHDVARCFADGVGVAANEKAADLLFKLYETRVVN